MTADIVRPKNSLSSKREYSARSFSASQWRTCFLHSFVVIASLELFYRSL